MRPTGLSLFRTARSPPPALRRAARANCRPSATVADYRDYLIAPGFVDTHIHFVQTGIIGAQGRQLLDWLDRYTYPAEEAFADEKVARATARVFCDELLRNGTTTALVFCSVHPQSVDALFEEAAQRDLLIIAGKVLMDRNAPASLLDTAQTGYDQSKALIAKWHGRGRLRYAVTPRFAGTSTPEQLELAGALWAEHPDVHMQTHIAEKRTRGGVDPRALSQAPRLFRHLRAFRPDRPPRGARAWHPSR